MADMQFWVRLCATALLPILFCAAGPAADANKNGALDDCAANPTAPCKAILDFGSDIAAQKLGGRSFVYWVERDTLRVAARTRQAAAPLICCSLQGYLDKAGADGGWHYWGARYVLPDITRSRLSLQAIAGDQPPSEIYNIVGASASPVPPQSRRLLGLIRTVTLRDPRNGIVRKVTFYRPPGRAPKSGFPEILIADGEMLSRGSLAAICDALIARKEIVPLVLVGVWSGESPPDDPHPFDLRNREYLNGPDIDPQAYSAYQKFVIGTVMPFAVRRFDAGRLARMTSTFGVSSGGSWAISFAFQHPEIAMRAAAVGTSSTADRLVIGQKGKVDLSVYSGIYDSGFANNKALCQQLGSYVSKCFFDKIYSGHEDISWKDGFYKSLLTLYPLRRTAALSHNGRLPS